MVLDPDEFCRLRDCESLAEGEFVPVQGKPALKMRLIMCEGHRREMAGDLLRFGSLVWEQWIPAPATIRRLQRMAEGVYG